MLQPTKLLSEILAMIDDMPHRTHAAQDPGAGQDQGAPQMTHAIRPVLIAGGEGNVTVLYAAGPVTIYNCLPSKVAAGVSEP